MVKKAKKKSGKRKKTGKKLNKKEKTAQRQDKLKHKARRISIKEGLAATTQFSLGYRYVSPFAIAINASDSMVALLGSIGGLLGPLSQLFGSRLIEKYSRKKIIRNTIIWEALMWIPYIIIAWLYYVGISSTLLPIILLLAYGVQLAIGNLATPAWFSWMGDIVDEEYRGRWWSKRHLLTGFVSAITILLSSVFLDYFRTQGWTMFGFMMLFGVALLGRTVSWHFFKQQYEPKLKLKKGDYFSFWSFILNSPKNNLGRFALFRAFFAFSISIASPLIAVYLLRNLGLSYTMYMVVIMTGTILSLFLLEIIGEIADLYGNLRVLKVTSFILPFVPILWMLHPSPIYLILVPSLIGGFAITTFMIAAGNVIYDNVSPSQRGLAVSYYNMLRGIGVFLGAGLGAILIKYIPEDLYFTPIVIVFIVSAVARLLTSILWLPKIKEVRKTKEYPGVKGIEKIMLKEAKPTLIEEAHQIMSIKNYLFEKGEQTKKKSKGKK